VWASELAEVDIFSLMVTSEEERKKKRKMELLKSLGIEELFPSGGISINMRICRGFDCQLCIHACPTKALYWEKGEVKITEELCVYCTACVINCIVDNCIKVWRVREDGSKEEFSTPREAMMVLKNTSEKKAIDATIRIIQGVEYKFLV